LFFQPNFVESVSKIVLLKWLRSFEKQNKSGPCKTLCRATFAEQKRACLENYMEFVRDCKKL
jgi:hypothetical protein